MLALSEIIQPAFGCLDPGTANRPPQLLICVLFGGLLVTGLFRQRSPASLEPLFRPLDNAVGNAH
jgi:hypothetical protein